MNYGYLERRTARRTTNLALPETRSQQFAYAGQVSEEEFVGRIAPSISFESLRALNLNRENEIDAVVYSKMNIPALHFNASIVGCCHKVVGRDAYSFAFMHDISV